MNKQELLAKYYAKKDQLRPYCPNRNRKEERLKSTIYTNIIDDLKQLDEPQKPVVPKVVAEWFEEHQENLEYKLWRYIRRWDQHDNTNEFHHWFDVVGNNAIETLIRMKDGYEVKKSPVFPLSQGDLVIRKGKHEAKIYIVEGVDESGILLVNGIKDEFYSDDEDGAADNDLDYFCSNFRLLAKKESLEVEATE